MKMLLICLATVLLFSCNGEKIKSTEASVATITTTERENKKDIQLCKINGEDWQYTTASGIIFTEKKSTVKKALFTFKKKIDKGSEVVQVEYNLENNTLIRVLVNIKRSNTEGNKISAHYAATEHSAATNKNIVLSGTIAISDSNTASGTANFKVDNRYEKTTLKHSEDLLIHVSNLHFSGVGYSDIDNTFGY
ncbi:hypothetical protein [Lacinutrix sp. Hel_I_90]|uniref:hypothetical protein n=1 Tax=Lacinutrix sp. Hel_I_90 TaxID=1249999 RepID=UPI0005C86574|nr:hypothetical protein [Lacinutrix sp. Hel_I_90]